MLLVCSESVIPAVPNRKRDSALSVLAARSRNSLHLVWKATKSLSGAAVNFPVREHVAMLYLLLELCSILVETFGRVPQPREAVIGRPLKWTQSDCLHIAGVSPWMDGTITSWLTLVGPVGCRHIMM